MKNNFNPWEETRNFIQDVGDFKSLIYFIDSNEMGSTTQLNNESNTCVMDGTANLELIKQLNLISKIHHEKISLLEILYEKYRNESILSKDKNHKICDSISYLIEILEKFETNKIKIANLLHNTHMSENNIIKIKHNKKIDFLRVLKIVYNKVGVKDGRNDLDFIDLSLNIHPQTINKIVRKN